MRAFPVPNAPAVDWLRKQFSRRIASASEEDDLELGRILVHDYDRRSGICYELIRHHPEAFNALGRDELEMLGAGIDSWGATDSFARHLSGPVWVRGGIDDDTVRDWAHSPNRWWRRAALVSTVALNSRARGGTGNAARTLDICRRLIDDRDDMIVKAMTWALWELNAFDRDAVVGFLEQHEEALVARVKRQVRNKLETGMKNPSTRRRR